MRGSARRARRRRSAAAGAGAIRCSGRPRRRAERVVDAAAHAASTSSARRQDGSCVGTGRGDAPAVLGGRARGVEGGPGRRSVGRAGRGVGGVAAAAARSRTAAAEPARSTSAGGRRGSRRVGALGGLADPADQCRRRPARGPGCAGAAPSRRSRSQRSTCSKRSVRNSCWSSWCRSSERARRNAWNRPWGSIATWENWVRFMPTRSVTRWPVSSSRVDSGTQAPSTRSLMPHRRLLGGRPVPRFLGRLPGGGADDPEPPAGQGRLERRRAGGRPASAWSERSRLASLRSPGTAPYRAKQTASRTLVLPAPVAPESRNSPASESASKSTVAGVGERAERGDLEAVQPHQAPPRGSQQGVDVGVVAAGVAGVAEQRGLGVGGRRRRAARRRSRARCRGRSAPGCGRSARRARRGRSGSKASTRACGNRRAQPLHRLRADGRRR